MKHIVPSKIMSGAFDGKRIWIYDYRYNDAMIKILRFLTPRQVLVRRDPGGFPLFYEIKEGKLNASPMRMIDKNGIPVKMYETEKDCVTAYLLNCQDIMQDCNDMVDNLNNVRDLAIFNFRKFEKISVLDVD